MVWIELAKENNLGHFSRPKRIVFESASYKSNLSKFAQHHPDLWKKDVKKNLRIAMGLLIKDVPLPNSFDDHKLNGILSKCRECHICDSDDNWVFMYKKVDTKQGKFFFPFGIFTHDKLRQFDKEPSVVLSSEDESLLNELLDSLE